jgi:very-short-patch-repair endonuclease
MKKKNLCKCGCGELVSQNYRHGHGRRGKKNSAYHNMRISECNQGRKWTAEQRAKFVKARTGVPRPAHVSDLMRKIALERGFGKWMKGRKRPREVVEKVRAHLIGRPVSEETRRKIGLANSGKNNGMYGTSYSAAQRAEQSAKMRLVMNWPDVKAKWVRTRSTPAFKRFLRLNAIKTQDKIRRRGYVTKPELRMKRILVAMKINFVCGYHFLRIKHPFPADFFLPEYRLVVEVDGLFWHRFPLGREIDFLRNKELESAGYKILRFWENELHPIYVQEELCSII